jgi:hypothetical protein
MRQRGSIAALSLALALVLPGSAFGAGDPVAHGSLTLNLSPGFRKQLNRNLVSMKPRSFSIASGSIDPIAGQGSVTLKGKLTVKHGRDKVVYDKLSAKLGPNGWIKNRKLKLFSLNGGGSTRNGFGTEIAGIRARFVNSAARNISKKLDGHSLRAMAAGKAAVSEQPETVQVIGGSLHFVPAADATVGSGTLVSKFQPHCVQGLTGVTAIAPGIKNPPLNTPSFDFPVTGGTIGPAGTDGVVNQSGGIQVVNQRTGGGVPSSCNSQPVNLATIQQTNFADNFARNTISSRVVITGPPSPLGGDRGTSIGLNMDTGNATVSADPIAHTITINGTVVRINKATALGLNQSFPQPLSTYNPSMEFVAGDLFGTIDLTVTTR